MGALKVWDGSAWQTVSQAGPPGTAPVTSVDTRTGAVVLSDLYISQADGFSRTSNWTTYTPTMIAEGGGGTPVPGTGGSIAGSYRMIAPYTLAVRTRLQWGTTAGNGGIGPICWTLPSGYTSAADMVQYMSDYVFTNDGFLYAGVVDVLANDVWMRPRTPWPNIGADRYVGTQGRVQTSGPATPVNWYPSGGANTWGVINVQQRGW